MKKSICLLFTVSCFLFVQAGTLNDNIGLTNFLFDSQNFDKVSQFKLQRYFCDNFRWSKDSTGEFWAQPTWQNFKTDDVLLNAKNNGVKNIWCTQGKMPHHTVQGKANKVNPVRDSDDPLLQSSWSDYGRLVKQIAIRYADDTQPYLSQVRVFSGSTYQKNTPKAGLGLVDAMEDRNEWDFRHGWSGAKYTLTPEQSAVGFKVFMDSVRSVSKTMKLIMGGTINPEVSTFTRFIGKLQQLYAAEGKPMPTDWYLCFHWYMRNGSINQTAGTWGVSPETAKAYKFGLQMDSLCRAYKLLGWYCTETGWSTYTTGTNVDLGKQNAPVLQGYDIYHSQGLCMVRLALTWGATEYCKGISFWHRKDNDDVGAYQNGGLNYANWQPKYAQTIIAEYLTKYRHHAISNYRTDGTLYAVDLTGGDSITTLVWTNQNKSGEYDAKPRIGMLVVAAPPAPEPPKPEPPQTIPTLKVQYSTGASHSDAKDLQDGSVLTPGFYYIHAEPEALAKPVRFWLTKNGVIEPAINDKRENGYPYDMNGGPAYNFTAGTYSLKVTSGTQTVTLAFTIGTHLPPVLEEPVIKVYIKENKVYYVTEKNVYVDQNPLTKP